MGVSVPRGRPAFFATLRGRTITVAIVAIVCVAAASAWSGHRSEQRLSTLMVESKLSSDRLMADKITDVHVEILQERLAHIVTAPLVDALRARDRATLRDYAVPPFNRLSSLVNLTKLTFYTSPNEVLFRAHGPEQASVVDGSRLMVADAFTRRSVLHGVEADDSEVGIFVLWPVYSAGHLVGVVEAGGSFGPIAQELADTLKAEVGIVQLSDPGAGPPRWLAGSSDVQSLPVERELAELRATSDRTRLAQGASLSLRREGAVLDVSLLPIINHAAQPVAAMVIMRDITPLANSLGASSTMSLVISLTGVGVALAFILWNISHVFGRLDGIIRAVRQFSAGGREVEIPTYRPDEVGTLGVSLQEMMTSIKESQSKLLESERRATEASYAKSVFMANMSHELRTPLNAIIGYSELVADELRGKPGMNSGEDLEKIHSAARNLLGIINDILDIARLDANKLKLDGMPVSVGALVSEAAEEAEPYIRRNDNTFHVAGGDSDIRVFVDPGRMKQVLSNILRNAAKFTSGGRVELAVSCPETARGRVVIAVKDTGIGIPADMLPALFKPFTQVDQSTSRRFGGLGVGLAISRRLCELMDATLDVTSSPGAGTTILISLPVYEEQRTVAGSERPGPSAGQMRSA